MLFENKNLTTLPHLQISLEEDVERLSTIDIKDVERISQQSREIAKNCAILLSKINGN